MRNLYSSHVLALIVCSSFLSQPLYAAPADVGQLVWSDDFNGNVIDPQKWSLMFPNGKWGDAINAYNATSVGGGALHLRAFSDSAGRQYSAVLATHNTFMAKYGYFESRMQFNDAPGEWSAFWLQSPKNDGTIVGNTTLAGTEIDVAEHRAVDGSGNNITGKVNSALHWDGYSTNAKSVEKLSSALPGVNNGSWHTYAVRWTPTNYTFYVDDRPTWTSNTAISATNEFLMLSTLVQNNTWAGTIPGTGYGSATTSTTGVNIDYVHVFALPEPTGIVGLIGAVMTLSLRRSRRKI
jgi:beta-glucanase (GH16 family)